MNKVEREQVITYRTTAMPWAGRTATGYGHKVPTCYQIKLEETRNVWRRVYCRIFSNSGTCYVIVNGVERSLNFEQF